MMTRRLAGGVVAAAAVVAVVGVALTHDDRGGDAVRGAVRGAAAAGATAAGADAQPTRSWSGRTDAPEAPAARQRAAAAVTVRQALGELRELYGYAGVLDSEAARALIARRRAAGEVLVGRLAALGADGVGPIVAAYGTATTGREKLTLIAALAANPSPAAAAGLAGLLAGEETFSYRRAIIEALGDSRAPEASARLAETLAAAADARERITAIKALGRGDGASEALIARATGDPDVGVRIAALARLSELGGEGAVATLDRLAGSGDEGVRVRSAAIAGLARSFPERAIGALGRLAVDEQAAVREAVVRALERLAGTDAVALLRRIAADDAAASVRSRAEQALARIAL